MRHFKILLTIAAVAMFTLPAVAQREGEGPRGEGRRDRPERRPGGPGGFLRMFPLVQALDADEDGELSSQEIENAVAALKSLDENEDGKLSREEYLPTRPPGFGGRRGGPRGPRGADRGPDRSQFIARMMEFDENEDGKISKDEAPQRMQRGFARIDANEDGYLTKEELEEMGRRFRGRRGAGRTDRPQRPE